MKTQQNYKFLIIIIFEYQISLLFKMDPTKNWSDHLKMGQIQIKNRICMAALTRTRCDPKNGIPTDLVVQYYQQRAGCGILLTEASAWSQRGHSFPGAANFYTKQHYQGWKRVVDAVHKKGGKLFIQLFHGGRATDEKTNGGLQVWAPSAIAIRGPKWPSNDPHPTPKEMTIQNIKQTQQEFRKAVIAAKQVGFDGVQLHGAHGYIIDQFLRSESNKRTDEYGGSAQKRSRFCLELLDICLEHFQPYRIGLKISPVSQFGDIYDKDPVQTYSYLLKQVNKRKIGFVEIRESSEYGADKKGSGAKVHYEKTPPQQIQLVCKTFRPFYDGIIVANDSFTPQRGIQFIRNGWADMVSFGRLYISNPDLAERIIRNEKLNNNWDFSTFFSPLNPKGYTDYPFYEQWVKQQTQHSQTKL